MGRLKCSSSSCAAVPAVSDHSQQGSKAAWHAQWCSPDDAWAASLYAARKGYTKPPSRDHCLETVQIHCPRCGLQPVSQYSRCSDSTRIYGATMAGTCVSHIFHRGPGYISLSSLPCACRAVLCESPNTSARPATWTRNPHAAKHTAGRQSGPPDSPRWWISFIDIHRFTWFYSLIYFELFTLVNHIVFIKYVHIR